MSGDAVGEADLVVERRGHVLVVRINRPEARNALTVSVMEGIGAAIREAESDAELRAVVLTGTGDQAFCAGLDLRAFADGEIAMGAGEDSEAFQRLLHGEVGVPLVGAANGTAVAGGLELLLGCDLAVVAEGSKLGLPEVRRGLFAGGGGTFLGTRIPLAIALELTLTGDTIDADRALAIGLVNAVVPAAEVLPRALDYAERIAANGPLAVRATKELVRLSVVDGPAGRARLAEWQPKIFGSEDAVEGATAFVERRPPVWKGR